MNDAAAGTVLDTLSASSADIGDTFSFTMTNTAGGLFALSGADVVTAPGSTFTIDDVHAITVRATAPDGSFQEATCNMTVILGVVVGQQEFTAPGETLFTVPAGVTSISMVGIGGGGKSGNNDFEGNSGNGGSLGYKNNLAVTPGQKIKVFVCAGGVSSTSTEAQATTFRAFGLDGALIMSVSGGKRLWASNGQLAPNDPMTGNDGGGDGGFGAEGDLWNLGLLGGGGGAGGYSGYGGEGRGRSISDSHRLVPQANGGGAGGGGWGAGGGGTGLYGKGSDGINSNSGHSSSAGGTGGSGGADGDPKSTSHGGAYGGGAGYDGGNNYTGKAGDGAARIIWPGDVRLFPETRVGDE